LILKKKSVFYGNFFKSLNMSFFKKKRKSLFFECDDPLVYGRHFGVSVVSSILKKNIFFYFFLFFIKYSIIEKFYF